MFLLRTLKVLAALQMEHQIKCIDLWEWLLLEVVIESTVSVELMKR